ncbi:MAG: hypothetical protein D6781_08890 [Verrucomicrobia bacterium]|nr:MAG: hypothetical protein D6781_08890 [Verrucomicrobiota bacterium]
MPRSVQVAPAEALVAADVNADGLDDLLVLHNDHSPSPVYGWLNGGLGAVLLGDGAGGFAAVPAKESGLVVPGDAEAAVLARAGPAGEAVVVVSQHGGPVAAFRLRGRDGS